MCGSVSAAEAMDTIKADGARLRPDQAMILSLTAASQVSSIVMSYLESVGKLNTFYAIHEIFDGMRRVIRGKAPLDTEQLRISRQKAERQLRNLEDLDDEPADLAADSLDLLIQVMRSLPDPSGPIAAEHAVAACDVTARLAEAVAESSDSLSPLVDGDIAGGQSLDATTAVIRRLASLPPEQLVEEAGKILGVTGMINVQNGTLMRSLIHAHC